MSARDAAAIMAELEQLGVRAWVDGGWGIDALAGEQTRPHADLDLAIDVQDEALLISWFEKQGFTIHEDERPTRFMLGHIDGRRIDIHPLTFDAEGSGTQTLQDERTFRYPPEGLAGAGSINGLPVRCLTPELQLRCHLGYPPDAEDIHDMHLLRDRFGLVLPPPYAEGDSPST